MKKLLLAMASGIGWFWRLFPEKIRTGFLTGLFVLDSRSPDPAEGLRRLMIVKDKLEWVINERAMAYGCNEHPKHRLTKYHEFFISRIEDGDRVLDVGCGYGAVARSIARERTRCKVTGMDIDERRLSQACDMENPANLNFYKGDATCEVPLGGWDVVVMSNVLEHLVDRIGFLIKLQKVTNASSYLIRVPLFERDWQLPLRRELGVNYLSDNDHKIEHRLDEFLSEITEAGLNVKEIKTMWGEIWANCQKQ